MPLIGILVEVPDPCGAQLQEFRRDLGDPEADMVPTHVTVLPPMVVDDADLSVIETHVAEVAAQSRAFDVRLVGTGTFRPVTPVVFVAVGEGHQEFIDLATRIRTGCLDVDLAYPYHPHVTVAHRLPDDTLDRAQRELAEIEVAFRVEEVKLYQQEPEGPWELIRSFPLTNQLI